ncbi:uncharacterized protein LOC127859304 isoform X2 [Dreissena polymorpha]|uniref:uncharacterized protein LOC127859304 isoform X2 n=1 Tax=Dreissena polymorpha TaxID=45954 RepID=UPI0022643564|nr:uncharacterized protein LOC127859304 isoform X2 [Dreissena polymorpha]
MDLAWIAIAGVFSFIFVVAVIAVIIHCCAVRRRHSYDLIKTDYSYPYGSTGDTNVVVVTPAYPWDTDMGNQPPAGRVEVNVEPYYPDDTEPHVVHVVPDVQPFYPAGRVDPYFNPDIQPYNPNTEPYNPNTEPYNPNTEPYNPNTEPYNPNTEPYNSQPDMEPYYPQPDVAPYTPDIAPFSGNNEPYNDTGPYRGYYDPAGMVGPHGGDNAPYGHDSEPYGGQPAGYAGDDTEPYGEQPAGYAEDDNSPY